MSVCLCRRDGSSSSRPAACQGERVFWASKGSWLIQIGRRSPEIVANYGDCVSRKVGVDRVDEPIRPSCLDCIGWEVSEAVLQEFSVAPAKNAGGILHRSGRFADYRRCEVVDVTRLVVIARTDVEAQFPSKDLLVRVEGYPGVWFELGAGPLGGYAL